MNECTNAHTHTHTTTGTTTEGAEKVLQDYPVYITPLNKLPLLSLQL